VLDSGKLCTRAVYNMREALPRSLASFRLLKIETLRLEKNSLSLPPPPPPPLLTYPLTTQLPAKLRVQRRSPQNQKNGCRWSVGRRSFLSEIAVFASRTLFPLPSTPHRIPGFEFQQPHQRSLCRRSCCAAGQKNISKPLALAEMAAVS
jgi:hypothetical protein